MPHYYYHPFAFGSDAYINDMKENYSFLKYTEIKHGSTGPKLNSDDVLHVIGHGEVERKLTLLATNTGKIELNMNDLAGYAKTFINTDHRLIILDCCYAMGFYMQNGVWTAANLQGDTMASILAKALGFTHTNIIVGGSASETLASANARALKRGEIGTKILSSPKAKNAFPSAKETGKTLIVQRVMFYLNCRGEYVTETGQPSGPPDRRF